MRDINKVKHRLVRIDSYYDNLLVSRLLLDWRGVVFEILTLLFESSHFDYIYGIAVLIVVMSIDDWKFRLSKLCDSGLLSVEKTEGYLRLI